MSTCSHTPIKHAGTSKGGVTCDGGAHASHEHRKIDINWDGSLRTCAEVNEGHECRRREPIKKLIPTQPPSPRIRRLQNQYSFTIWVTKKWVGSYLRGGNA